MEGVIREGPFSEETIVEVLREAEAGAKTVDVCRRHGISRGTLYRWRKRYGGLQVSDLRRLQHLEEENRSLKHIVAVQALNLQVLKDLLGNRL